MPVQRSNPNTIHTPGGYSHVVRAGSFVYLAGQVGVDKEGNLASKGDSGAQAAQAYRNILEDLASVGADWNNVVKTTVFVTGREHIAGVRKARQEVLTEEKPASTLVIVDGLALPEYLVEIEVVAYLD